MIRFQFFGPFEKPSGPKTVLHCRGDCSRFFQLFVRISYPLGIVADIINVILVHEENDCPSVPYLIGERR